MLYVQNKVTEIFTNSVKALKEFPKYRHLLLSTGLEDDASYDMNDDSSFSLDSNLSEFTSDAVRLSIMYYLYNYPNLLFDIDLLNVENVFTFSKGLFREELLTSIKKFISSNEDFFFPFLPVAGSSHWYTLCVSPSCKKIIIINPLEHHLEQKELNYVYRLMRILCVKLEVEYVIDFENAGIQTSGKSCGESTLIIMFSLLMGNANGYKNLVRHLHKDFPIDNLSELEDVIMGKFCKCNICLDGRTPFNIIQTTYIKCKNCFHYNPNMISNCNHCKITFNNDNCELLTHNSSVNRQNMERGLRMSLLNAVENCDLENPQTKCIKK